MLGTFAAEGFENGCRSVSLRPNAGINQQSRRGRLEQCRVACAAVKPKWKCVTRCGPSACDAQDIGRAEASRQERKDSVAGRIKSPAASRVSSKPLRLPDHRGSEAVRLKEFASDYLNFFNGDAFEHGDQFLRREMPVEIDVVAREAGHALARAFERESSVAPLKVVLRAAAIPLRLQGRSVMRRNSSSNGANELFRRFQRSPRVDR